MLDVYIEKYNKLKELFEENKDGENAVTMSNYKTERLELGEMTEDDFDALYKVLSDSDIMQHYPYTFDENRVKNWINKNIERYLIFGFGLWAVCL